MKRISILFTIALLIGCVASRKTTPGLPPVILIEQPDDTTIYYADRAAFETALKVSIEGYKFDSLADVHPAHNMIRYHKKGFWKSIRSAFTSDKPDSILTPFVILTFKEGFFDYAKTFAEGIGCKISDQFSNVLYVRLPPGMKFQTFEAQAKRLDIFESIEQDKIIPVESETADFHFSQQWAIKNMRLEQAWAMIPAGRSTTMAIFDLHKYEVTHPDLAGNIESYYNAVTDNTDMTLGPYDKHATPCAGIPGAVSNNGIGVAGNGNNQIKMICVTVGYGITSSGSGFTSSIILLRAYAYVKARSHCRVICQSFGSTASMTSIQAAITDYITPTATWKGGLVFASTGNAGIKDTWKNYPASYAGVIAVGSTTSSGRRSSFANHGKGLTVSGPGSGITSLDLTGNAGYKASPDPRYADYNNSFSGTSPAAPEAASVGSLVILYNPDLTSVQVRDCVLRGCDKTGEYTYTNNPLYPETSWSPDLGCGEVDGLNSLMLAGNYTPPPVFHNLSLTACSIPSTAQVNQNITISCRQNTDKKDAPAIESVVEYWWSTDASWSATDVLIGKDTSTLGGGTATEMESFLYRIPGNGTPGFVIIRASGNECSGAVNVTLPTVDGTDASVEILSITPSQDGLTCLIKFQFKNTGTNVITRINYRAGWDHTTNAGGSIFQTIAPGNKSIAIQVTRPFNFDPGTYIALAEITLVNSLPDKVTVNNLAIKEVVKP